MDWWLHFSALPEGEVGGDPLSLPLPITGAAEPRSLLQLAPAGDLQTPSSESPANSSTMQGTTLLSPHKVGAFGAYTGAKQNWQIYVPGTMDCQRCLWNGVDYSFKDLSARFLKLLSTYGGGIPQLALHEQLRKQGSLVGTGLCRVYFLLALLLFCR